MSDVTTRPAYRPRTTRFGRTICDEPILFWRTEAGQVTAHADRCVHRRFPLSQAPSRLVGDTVVCGYHGFTYGADGVPGGTVIGGSAPSSATTTSSRSRG